MKRFCLHAGILLAAMILGSVPAHAAGVARCSTDQLLAYAPSDDEVAAHRSFDLPVISYPFDAKIGEAMSWSGTLDLTLRTDESGKVVCYAAKDFRDREVALDDRQRALVDGLNTWRYAPFTEDGKPVAAVFKEHVRAQELPEKHLPLPEVPLDQVHITLERTACFGSCPAYQVDVYGDGRVVYLGKYVTDVEGEHRYRIPVQDVAKLVDSLRAKDIWSLRPEYRAEVTDLPTFVLTMDMGGQVHKLVDYAGPWVGMPAAVSDFEQEVDRVTHSDQWIYLSSEAVAQLKSEGFKFDSQAGADLLARTVMHPFSKGNDDGPLALIQLGAPLQGSDLGDSRLVRGKPGSLLEMALRNHRWRLVQPLIERGALRTDGKPESWKIDAAFRAAIAGGQLAAVKAVWDAAGARARPSLSFDDVAEIRPVHRESPVTLLLEYNSYQWEVDRDPHAVPRWDGLAIARWLIAKGCNPKAVDAEGKNLLHIAAKANDVDFARYLLGLGLNPSAADKDGIAALGYTDSDDVAMLLLQAGADPSRFSRDGGSFRKYAMSRQWPRAVAWLDARPRK